MPSVWPYGDVDYPTVNSTHSSELWANITGMAAVTETAARVRPAFGGAAWLGYHLACTEDYYSIGACQNAGRWFTLHTPGAFQNGSDLTSGSYSATERRLLGGHEYANGEESPDISVMGGTAFASDGKGRWLAGQAPPGFVYIEDNSAATFADESADAASLATNDVNILPAGDSESKVNDACYIGAAATFNGICMDVTTGVTIGSGGTNLTMEPEYWNGSAWVSIAGSTGTGQDFSHALLTPALSSAQLQRFVFNRSANMSDWATTTVDGQSAYWVRLRCTIGASGTGYTQPKARSIYLIEDNCQTSPLLPASYEVGNDPNTTAPSVKAWGLHRLDVNGSEQASVSITSGGSVPAGKVNIWYTWRDSTRDIETDPVSLGNYTFTAAANNTATVVIGDHPDPNVDQIRFYFQGTSGVLAEEAEHEGDPASIGTGLLRLVGQFALTNSTGTITDLIGGGTNNDRTTAWEAIARNRVGDGPYLASTIPNGIGLQPDVAAKDGFYLSNCIQNGRIYCAGTTVVGYEHRVVWSIANNPYCFPKDNFIDLPMSDGDRIVAIRSAGSHAVVLGAHSVWSLAGDPESSNVAVSRIADVGCLAKKAAITVGQRCFFLGGAGIYAVGSGGSVELVTPRLNRLFRDLFGSTVNSVVYQGGVGAAVAGYDPSREFVLFAVPGLAQQLSGGADLGQMFNDGYIQIDLMTGRSSVLIGPPCSSMATTPTGNAGFELWSGSPYGRLTRLTTDVLDGNATSAISGTVAGTHSSTTLQDTGLSLTASSSDGSFMGQILYKVNAAGTTAEGRMILSNDTDTFTVASAWTNNPVDGDLYYIGHYWMSAETGDITHEDPGSLHRMIAARLHMESGMNAGNALTVLSTPNLRSESTTWVTGGAAVASKAVQKLSLGADSGYTQRLRVLARMGAARFRLFALAVGRTLGGRADG